MSSLRISGLASGMDTETMIKDLMKAEGARLDKVKQDKQYVTWQQEAYRETIDQIKKLQSDFFDVLKSSNNITSKTSFGQFNYSITSGIVNSTALSVIAQPGISSRTQTVNEITKLATKDTWSGNASGLSGIKTTDLTDIAALKTKLGVKDLEFTLAIGSSTKTIAITQAELTGITTSTQLKDQLNIKIGAAFGADYANIVSESVGTLKLDMAGNTLKVLTYGTDTESMTALGLTSGQSSLDFKTKGVGTLFALTNADLNALSINGTNISIDETDTIDQMVDKVNKSGAGVTMAYNVLSDNFTMTANNEGSANNITISDTTANSTLFNQLFKVSDYKIMGANRVPGVNAQLTINGKAVIQSSNNFSFDGITYKLKETSATAIDIGIAINSDDVVDNIKNFITDYNKIVDTLSTKVNEKKNYDYKPLTDAEREALSEDEIKSWEIKAKSGVLRSSSELSTFLTKMRSAFIDPIEGVGISLRDIGIASTNYADRGKLTIDDAKLKNAIENNYDEVVNLFTAKSTTAYLDSANSSTRYSESGIGSRLEDIMKDYTRTTRDTNGQKGILIVKAGMLNDSSVVDNSISKTLSSYDTRIAKLMDYLDSRESYYYGVFSRMEAAMSQLQAQGDSLMSQLGA